METGRKIAMETVVGGAAVEVRFSVFWNGGGWGRVGDFFYELSGLSVPIVVGFLRRASCCKVQHVATVCRMVRRYAAGRRLLRRCVVLRCIVRHLSSYSVHNVPTSVGLVRFFCSLFVVR